MVGDGAEPASSETQSYSVVIEGLKDEHVGHMVKVLGRSEERLSWGEVLALWRSDAYFCTLFSEKLAEVPYEDFFWETPAVSGSQLDAIAFECVVLNAGGNLIDRHISSTDFREHLRKSPDSLAVAFPNLGGDAQLVAPKFVKGTDRDTYGSLSTFLRMASKEQKQELWQVTANTIIEMCSEDPERSLWVNTDGNGVPWLHIRIDSAPKYIKFDAYSAVAPRDPPGRGGRRFQTAGGARKMRAKSRPADDSVKDIQSPTQPAP